MVDNINDLSQNYEAPVEEKPVRSATRPSSEEDRDSFHSALERNEHKAQHSGDEKKKNVADGDQDDSKKKKKGGMAGMADEIFKSLARSGSPAADIKAETLRSDQNEAVERINEMCRQLLVAGEGVSSKEEVMIRLKDNIFPGTEIRLSMEQGQLHVNINTQEQAAFGMLSQYSDQLTERLENKLAEKCIVNVEMGKGEGRKDSRSDQQQSGSSRNTRGKGA